MEARVERSHVFTLAQGVLGPIAEVTHDNRVLYRGEPISHENLAQAIHLWLAFRGEVVLKELGPIRDATKG
jgi:hypothetical protein